MKDNTTDLTAELLANLVTQNTGGSFVAIYDNRKVPGLAEGQTVTVTVKVSEVRKVKMKSWVLANGEPVVTGGVI